MIHQCFISKRDISMLLFYKTIQTDATIHKLPLDNISNKCKLIYNVNILISLDKLPSYDWNITNTVILSIGLRVS